MIESSIVVINYLEKAKIVDRRASKGWIIIILKILPIISNTPRIKLNEPVTIGNLSNV